MKRPQGPAHYLESGVEYTIQQYGDNGWGIQTADDPDSPPYTLRFYQELTLTRIPEDVRTKLGLKETEEAELRRTDTDAAVLRITREVSLSDLMGKGIRLRLRRED